MVPGALYNIPPLQVELTDCDYTRRNTSHAAEKLLKQLFFQPFFYDGTYRRKLTLQEISTYQVLAMLACDACERQRGQSMYLRGRSPA